MLELAMVDGQILMVVENSLWLCYAPQLGQAEQFTVVGSY